jgi:hypothetical protein
MRNKMVDVERFTASGFAETSISIYYPVKVE